MAENSRDETICLKQHFAGALEAQTRFVSPLLPHFSRYEAVPTSPHCIVLFVGQCGGGNCGTLVCAIGSDSYDSFFQVYGDGDAVRQQLLLYLDRREWYLRGYFGRHYSTIDRLQLVS